MAERSSRAPKPKAEVRDVLHALNDILVLAEPHLVELWKSMDMTFLHVRVLRRLRLHGMAWSGELAAAVGISAASLTRILAKLEEKGLVKRRMDRADRRRVEVDITPLGRALVGDRGLLTGTVFEEAARAMTQEERAALIDRLASFRRVLAKVGNEVPLH